MIICKLIEIELQSRDPRERESNQSLFWFQLTWYLNMMSTTHLEGVLIFVCTSSHSKHLSSAEPLISLDAQIGSYKYCVDTIKNYISSSGQS